MRKIEHKVGRPRLRTIEKMTNSFVGRYKGHIVDVHRDTRGENWYVMVTAPDGCYVYDGWWRDSAYKTRRAAILEALIGSQLWAPN